MSKNLHVAVVLGGMSAEREVSLNSGKAIADSLRKQNYHVSVVDMNIDIVERLQVLKPDVIFNALHGTYGEDGCLQGILNILKIPYTHSGLLSSALCMNKMYSKHILTANGIRCAEGKVMDRASILKEENVPEGSYVVKPLNEGSSVGVHILFPEDEIRLTEESLYPGEFFIVEPYIPGREIQVAVLQQKAIGAIEIRPIGRFYDYEAKYTEGKAVHIMPAPLPDMAYQQLLKTAEKAHAVLGCKTVSRVDFRFDDTQDPEGIPYCLEVNTHPGFTSLSLVPEIAAHHGISFERLCEILIEEAAYE